MPNKLNEITITLKANIYMEEGHEEIESIIWSNWIRDEVYRRSVNIDETLEVESVNFKPCPFPTFVEGVIQ